MSKISIKYDGSFESLKKSVMSFKKTMYPKWKYDIDIKIVEDIIIPEYDLFKNYIKICFQSFNIVNTSLTSGPIYIDFFKNNDQKETFDEHYFSKDFVLFILTIAVLLIIFSFVLYIYSYFYGNNVVSYVLNFF